MNDLNQKLINIFTALKNSELVVTKTANDTTITEFNDKLNEAIQTEEFGNHVGDFIRFLYKNDRRSFYNYLKISNLQHLTLLTDGQALIGALDIKGLISITYRYRQRDFVVTKDAWTDNKMETVNSYGNERWGRSQNTYNVRSVLDRKPRTNTNDSASKTIVQAEFPVLSVEKLPPVNPEKYSDMMKSARRHKSAVVEIKEPVEQKQSVLEQLNEAEWS